MPQKREEKRKVETTNAFKRVKSQPEPKKVDGDFKLTFISSLNAILNNKTNFWKRSWNQARKTENDRTFQGIHVS